MNSFERYRGVLEGKPVDIVPRLPLLMQFAAEYIGSNYGAFASDYLVLVESNIRCVEDFDFDQVSGLSDPYRETQGFGAEIEFVKDGVPRCPRPPLAEHRNLAVLPQPDPLTSVRMRDRIDAIAAFKSRVGGRYSIQGWIEGPAAEAADLRGVMNFLYDVMDDEGWTAELMDRCTETGIAFAGAQIDAGADTVAIGDAIASQISPEFYERLILPREQRLVDAIHARGAWVRLHICGNTTHLLNGIAGLGVDILDVDHMVNMSLVRKIVGGKTVLTGNIDPASGVHSGAPAAIRARMQAIYQQVGNPYMVNAGCEVPAGTPQENLKALCEPIPYR